MPEYYCYLSSILLRIPLERPTCAGLGLTSQLALASTSGSVSYGLIRCAAQAGQRTMFDLKFLHPNFDLVFDLHLSLRIFIGRAYKNHPKEGAYLA